MYLIIGLPIAGKHYPPYMLLISNIGIGALEYVILCWWTFLCKPLLYRWRVLPQRPWKSYPPIKRGIREENWDIFAHLVSIFNMNCSEFASVLYRTFRRLYQVVQMMINGFQSRFKFVDRSIILSRTTTRRRIRLIRAGWTSFTNWWATLWNRKSLNLFGGQISVFGGQITLLGESLFYLFGENWII